MQNLVILQYAEIVTSGTFFGYEIQWKAKIKQQKLTNNNKNQHMLQLSHCYKLLHLEQDCSDLELRQRYRKIALELHPDKLRIDDNESQRDSCEFVKLNEAYKQITSYRKQKRAHLKKRERESSQMGSRNIKLMSFQDIKRKIMDLNKVIDHNTSHMSHSSNFTEEIDTLYDQHLKIMQNMSEKLRLMRGK